MHFRVFTEININFISSRQSRNLWYPNKETWAQSHRTHCTSQFPEIGLLNFKSNRKFKYLVITVIMSFDT